MQNEGYMSAAMEERLDTIYEAADALLKLMNPGYEHNMRYCGEIVDYAEDMLRGEYKRVCYPYMTDNNRRCDADFDENGKLCCGYESCTLCQRDTE